MQVSQLVRLESGVEGLDALLRGGFVSGCSYLIQGRPGSGKTILANQIAFNFIRSGGQAVFATLLSESHDRMFSFLSTLSFFDKSCVGRNIKYLSAFDTLDSEGLDQVITLLRQEIIRNNATLLIVDGLLNARSQAETPLDTKKFIAELQAHAAFVGCTLLFLTSAVLDEGSPELTMVDGMIALEEQGLGVRSIRRMSVRKSRGSGAIAGLHEYQITDQGIVVHPRLEALLRAPTAPLKTSREKIPSGVPTLDEALCGGLCKSSVSLILGPSGAGKTTLGLNFILQSTTQEPGLIFGFYETPEQLDLKAQALELDLQSCMDLEVIRMHWQPTTELQLDSVGYGLLDTVREHRIKRVLIDSVGAMARSAIEQNRLVEFFSALFNELRAMDVTVFGTWEVSDLLGSDINAPAPELCSLVDNLFLMRFEEKKQEFRSIFSILKLRNSPFDRSQKDVSIGKGGMTLIKPLKKQMRKEDNSSSVSDI
jgi:circadian clock protein KaiC